jgi:hypothetical protein
MRRGARCGAGFDAAVARCALRPLAGDAAAESAAGAAAERFAI